MGTVKFLSYTSIFDDTDVEKDNRFELSIKLHFIGKNGLFWHFLGTWKLNPPYMAQRRKNAYFHNMPLKLFSNHQRVGIIKFCSDHRTLLYGFLTAVMCIPAVM
jgi:hypothetical protein